MSELIQLLFIMLYMFEFIYVYLCKKNVGGIFQWELYHNWMNSRFVKGYFTSYIHTYTCTLRLNGKAPEKCFSPFKKKQKEWIYVWIKIKDKQFKEPRRRRSFGFGIRIQYFFTKKDLPLWSSNFQHLLWKICFLSIRS